MDQLLRESKPLQVGLEVVEEAAEIYQNHAWDDAELKSPQQLVTEVDVRIEQRVKRRLSEQFPEHAFVGEEEGSEGGSESVWYIDPIDGTTDFVYDLPHSSISVAFVAEGTRKVGIVYHPKSDTTYAAVAGEGAYRNGESISVSAETELDRALFGIGFSQNDVNDPILQSAFRFLINETLGVRRYGSAALQLCYAADGTFDGFLHRNLSSWDVAAGSLIVEEAGGVVTDFSGNSSEEQLLEGDIVATNERLRDRIEFGSMS